MEIPAEIKQKSASPQPNLVELTDPAGGLAEVPDLMVGLALADADGHVAVEKVGPVVLHARPRRGVAEGRGGGLQAGEGTGRHEAEEQAAVRRHRSKMIEAPAALFCPSHVQEHGKSNKEEGTYGALILQFEP